MPVGRVWGYEEEVLADLCWDYVVAARAEPLVLAARLSAGKVGPPAYYEVACEFDDKAAEQMRDEALLSEFARKHARR